MTCSRKVGSFAMIHAPLRGVPLAFAGALAGRLAEQDHMAAQLFEKRCQLQLGLIIRFDDQYALNEHAFAGQQPRQQCTFTGIGRNIACAQDKRTQRKQSADMRGHGADSAGVLAIQAKVG